MKTERRHELQTNVLADYLGKHLQRIQPYSKHISLGVMLIVVAILAGLYFSNKRAAEMGAGWSDFLAAFAATDPDALEEVANLHDGSTAGIWARLSAGEIKVAMGTGQLFTDRDEAEKSLKAAREHFDAVVKEAGGQPQLVERARFGLAQVYESLSDIEKAQKYYDEVAKTSPDSTLGQLAKQRFERLSDKSVQRWYAWFERQEPKPPMPPGGMGIEPKVSDDLDLLPQRPDLSYPGSDVSEDFMDMDLTAPLGKEDAPLDKETVEPKSSEPKKTPSTADEGEPAASKDGGTPKPDDSPTETKPDSEAAKDAEEPSPEPKESATTDSAKPADKPAVSDESDTKPDSKDASS